MNEELNITDPNVGLHIGMSFGHADERGSCVRVRVVIPDGVPTQPETNDREVSTLVPIANALEAAKWFVQRVESATAFQQGVESIRPEVEKLTTELAEAKEKLAFANTLLDASVAVMEADKKSKVD